MTTDPDNDPGDLNPGAKRPRLTVLINAGFALAIASYGAQAVLHADLQTHWQSMQLPDSPFFVEDPSFPDFSSWEHFFRYNGFQVYGYFLVLFSSAAHLGLLPRKTPTKARRIAISLGAPALLLIGALGAVLLTPASWTDQSLEGLLGAYQYNLWLFAGLVAVCAISSIMALRPERQAPSHPE